jgi:adenylate kinase family enzyme
VLTDGDPLPLRPRRVLVCGVTGSGKSTLAATLAGVLDLPYTEIDGLQHGPDWTPRPQFLDEVQALAAGDAWITEWQYRAARPVLLARADLLVWLDLPFRVSMTRLVGRTVRRRVRREVLWHGNQEPPLHTFFTRPDDSILRWGISTRDKYRDRIPDVQRERPELPIVRLGSPREAEQWVRGIVQGRLLPQR